MKDLTESVIKALSLSSCTVIPDTSLFLSDRPLNAGKPFGRGDKGNSDFEVGHSFNLCRIVSKITTDLSAVQVALNNIRIFGPIDKFGFPHYHGYSKNELYNDDSAFQFLFMTVHAIAPYNSQTGLVQMDQRVSEIELSGHPGLVLLHEDEGIYHVTPLRAGDTIVLPSGAYHTFSALPGVFGSYGAIEICNNPAKMYQTHYEDNSALDPREIVARTIRKFGNMPPDSTANLSLGDIPGFEYYVEDRT